MADDPIAMARVGQVYFDNQCKINGTFWRVHCPMYTSNVLGFNIKEAQV
jgi:hypothetical protein